MEHSESSSEKSTQPKNVLIRMILFVLSLGFAATIAMFVALALAICVAIYISYGWEGFQYISTIPLNPKKW